MDCILLMRAADQMFEQNDLAFNEKTEKALSFLRSVGVIQYAELRLIHIIMSVLVGCLWQRWSKIRQLICAVANNQRCTI